MSCYIGRFYHNLTSKNRYQTILKLLIITLLLWIIFFLVKHKYLPSRSLANFTYVTWGLANGSLHILICSIFDSVFPENFRFVIFAEMISEYRLEIFLLANILSTIIRRIADIKSLSVLYTVKVVFIYLFITCFIISVFFYRNHVKFYSSNSNSYSIKKVIINDK